jgi:hypothetical protein
MWWECERALLRSKLEGFCDTITCQNLFKKSEKSEFDSIIEFGNRIIPQGLFFRLSQNYFSSNAINIFQ